MIRFEQTGTRGDGEILYRLIIDDRVIREGMTIDEVIAEIHRSDESIGARHVPRPVREPAADRRRMARREPSQARNDATRGDPDAIAEGSR